MNLILGNLFQLTLIKKGQFQMGDEFIYTFFYISTSNSFKTIMEESRHVNGINK